MSVDDRLAAAGRSLRDGFGPDAPAFDRVLARHHRTTLIRRAGGALLAAALAAGISVALLPRGGGGQRVITTAPIGRPPTSTTTAGTSVTVPDVLGATVADAVRRFEALRLNVAVAARPAPIPHTVVVESPPAGTKVAPGSTVTIEVSTGPTPLQHVDWSSITYPVSCGGQTVGTPVAYPTPDPGSQLAVVFVQCVHGAGSPPSAVLLFDYAMSPTQPHLAQTLLSYQDDWSPRVDGVAPTGPNLAIQVDGYTGNTPRCCPDIHSTLTWKWQTATGQYQQTSTEPTHDTLPAP